MYKYEGPDNEWSLVQQVVLTLSKLKCRSPTVPTPWSSVKAPERFVCSPHTLSASSYLWQVVWHPKSPPAGPLQWQPAAQRGEGFLGIVDKWLFSRAPSCILHNFNIYFLKLNLCIKVCFFLFWLFTLNICIPSHSFRWSTFFFLPFCLSLMHH